MKYGPRLLIDDDLEKNLGKDNCLFYLTLQWYYNLATLDQATKIWKVNKTRHTTPVKQKRRGLQFMDHFGKCNLPSSMAI